MKRTRKIVAMTVHVACPANMPVAAARREVRALINTGAGHATNPGDPDGVRAMRISPPPGALYNRKPKGSTK